MSNYSNETPQIIFTTGLESCPTLFDCADCDCACSQTADSLPSQPQLMSSMPYRTNFQTMTLNQNYVVCYNPLHDKPAVLNRAAWQLLAPFEQPRYLCRTGILPVEHWPNNGTDKMSVLHWRTLEQAIQLGLLVPSTYIPTLTPKPTTLSAWLHLTHQCNLRCTYCYLDHAPKPAMSLSIGQAAIEATFRSAVAHHYRQVKLKYAGGEPLLRFPLIRQLHRHAQALADSHNLELEGVVLSNGTLLQAKMIKDMKALNLRLMISLDGLGNFHDDQRCYADGRGTSQEVIQAIELAVAHDLKPYISVTVTENSAAGLADLVAWILAHDLPFNLNFQRAPLNQEVSPTPNSNSNSPLLPHLKAAFKVIEANLPRRSLLASLIDRANLATPHLKTCGVGHNYLVFDTEGQVSKCQMTQHAPITTAQATDPLAILQADTTMPNISVEQKKECATCEWKYWCAGGCPLVTYQATGRYDVKSPYCHIYQALYPEAIRLEGLRLLKYATSETL